MDKEISGHDGERSINNLSLPNYDLISSHCLPSISLVCLLIFGVASQLTSLEFPRLNEQNLRHVKQAVSRLL